MVDIGACVCVGYDSPLNSTACDVSLKFPEFDLGKLQNGRRIDDVELPAWAESPEHFIIKHREALVSSFTIIFCSKI